MADIVKMAMHTRCGVGGLKCYCCNSYKGKLKSKLSRMVRRVLKQKDRE